MSQVSIDKELHEEGNCDPLYCPYCEKEVQRKQDWEEGEADFRYHERIDNEGPGEKHDDT